MGAIALSHLAYCGPVTTCCRASGSTAVQRLFAQEFGRFGIDVSFVNPLEQRTWKRGSRRTRARFRRDTTNPCSALSTSSRSRVV